MRLISVFIRGGKKRKATFFCQCNVHFIFAISICFLIIQLHYEVGQREGERAQAIKSSTQASSLVKYLEQRETTLLHSLQEVKKQQGKAPLSAFPFFNLAFDFPIYISLLSIGFYVSIACCFY